MKQDLYEVGYLLRSTLTESDVAQEVDALHAAITKAEGEVVHTSEPRLRDLAYRIAQKDEGKRTWFDSGYFGWSTFTTDPAKIALVQEKLTEQETLLRFIIVKTSAEAAEAALEREVRADEEAEEAEMEEDTEEDVSEEDEGIDREKAEVNSNKDSETNSEDKSSDE